MGSVEASYARSRSESSFRKKYEIVIQVTAVNKIMLCITTALYVGRGKCEAEETHNLVYSIPLCKG